MKALLLKCTIAVVICLAAGALGSLATDTGSWYQQLNKPSFNPPSWVFGPVWTLLYICMGIAAGLVWNLPKGDKTKRIALLFFWAQLVLNALWSFSFFGAQNPQLGLVNIVLLLLVLASTVYFFFKLHETAGWLLVPYLAWVGFASLLNLQIVRLN
jgi:translocator protein